MRCYCGQEAVESLPVQTIAGVMLESLCVEHVAEVRERATVKRVDIFGQVHDTHATEAELNGWRSSQGMLL